MNYQTGQVVEVTASEVAHGGWCVARPGSGPVVFVRHALPGERVLARITEVTSRLVRAEVADVLAASPDRVEPPCPHAGPGRCGGCDWQHAALPAQRALKAAVIRQQLRRLAGIEREVTVEALPGDGDDGESPAPARPAGLGWRTRVRFAVRADGVAGLHAHRSHEVIDVGTCLIAHPVITDLAIPRRRWPGVAVIEAIAGTGPGESEGYQGGRPPGSQQSAVIVSPDGTGRTRGHPVSMEGITADSVLRRTGPHSRSLAPLRGRGYLSQREIGRAHV